MWPDTGVRGRMSLTTTSLQSNSHLPPDKSFPVFYRRFAAWTQRADECRKAQPGKAGTEREPGKVLPARLC